MATRKRFRLNSDRLSKKSGLYPDGDGLYLSVTSKTAASWLFRYADGWKVSANGKRYPNVREIGLGSYPEIKLARARELAGDARRLKAEGIDPLSERKRLKAAQREEEAKAFTFKDCAVACVAAHRVGWKNAKHAAQWLSTLETYAFPIIGHLAVQAIDVALVTKVLEQPVEADRGYPAGSLWEARTETARRLRGRIESVLDWAAARGRRSRENPARWKGAQQSLLPRHTKVRQVTHHPALPYADLPDFMAQLRGLKGVSPLALQFTILTASRTGESTGARWDEIDEGKGVWSLPGSRMKSGREHRVLGCCRFG
jgi:hypothetical protein